MQKQNQLIHSAFLMIAIDGKLEESEVESLVRDDFWQDLYFEGCFAEFLELLNEERALDVCRKAIERQLSTENQKKDFVFALLRLVMADGQVDENELALLNTLASFAKLSTDDVSTLIEEWGESLKSQVHNKLILSALFMCASDGNLDDNEIKVIQSDAYWSKLIYAGCVDEFTALEYEDLKTLCAEQTAKHITTEEAQLEYIDALLRIILADGEVEENEILLLNILVGPLGITPDALTEIIKGYSQRRLGTAARVKSPSAESDNSGCAGIIVAFLVITTLASFIVF
jgi:uncharacterized tellurite resistance protein B-like protein